MRSLAMNVAVALAAIALTWWLAFQPRLELAATNLDRTQQQLDAARQLDADRVSVIRAQAGQLALVLQNELKNRELLAQIASQGRAQSAALQELKRNDKAILEYLDQPVPADLGRLYQRAGGADPAAYRQQADVRTDALPSASKASAAGE